ncbi:MAG: Gfo/Idh/MocA family oxidoreductase [Firmicutes bacterium]|nr:Gfo/Idh/MocA family oxidoreductase [Bacillota bacterium]
MNLAFAGFRHSHIFALYRMALKNPDVNIVGCFEADDPARMQAEEALGAKFQYASYEEILNSDEIDAIAIGDYYQKRGSMIIEALKHGKHVICDKPLCTELSELEQIQKLSSENQLKVSCMLDLRYLAAAKKARELIREGAIGTIGIVSFTGQHFLDCGHRPKWYFEDGKHGGTINDIGIHGIDLVRFITGKNLSTVTAAKVWNRFATSEPGFKDCGQFMVDMEEISVIGDVSYAAPNYDGILPTYWSFYFWGTTGMLHFNLKDSRTLLFYNKTEQRISCPENKSDYLSDFISEIQGKPTDLRTEDILESAAQTLRIQEAAK